MLYTQLYALYTFIHIGINFRCQQNTRYLQLCIVESKTVMYFDKNFPNFRKNPTKM